MPSPQPAVFDPTAGSTVNAGIDGAFVPDATLHMKEIAYIAIMTPLGDPFDKQCIWGAPTCFWGLPAVAKSDRVRQAAIEANLPYATIFPGQRQPEDFSGALMPGKEGPTIECLLGAVRYLNGQGKGVLFLDEMGDATPITQAAMLGFIQDRVCGDTPVHNEVRILCAANPPEWSTSGFSMKPTTANRMCHFQVKCPPTRDWIGFMLAEGAKPIFDATGTEETIRQNWGSCYSHVLALFTGYMEARRVTLHQQPPRHSRQCGYCWASPRTWRLAARMVGAAECLGQSDQLKTLIVEGCVGEGCATDFYTWVRSANIPKPEEVLSRNWVPDRRRLDIAFAVMTSVTQYIINLRDKQQAIEAAIGAWRLYRHYIDNNMGDLVVASAKALVSRDLSRSNDPRLKEVADPVMKWMGDNRILQHVPA